MRVLGAVRAIRAGRRRDGHRIGSATLMCVAALWVFVMLVPAASAQDRDGVDEQDQVVLHGRLTVAEGESVGTAVIFDGPAIIDGTVTQTLVVFNGRADVSGTVREDVVVFNGDVTVRSGARVGGDVLSRESPTIEDGATIGGDVQGVATRFDYEDLWFSGRVAWWIGYSVSTLVLGLLLLLFVPGLDDAAVHAIRQRMGGTIGFGAATFFLLPVAAILLLVTIVGIPLGLFLLLAFAFLYTVGYVAGGLALGRLLVKPPTSRFLAFLAGLGILRLLALIPIVGGVVWVLAAIIGLGVLVVGARRRPSMATAEAPLPPAPASAT